MRKSIFWIAIGVAVTLYAATPRTFDTWRQYQGGGDSSQYSSLKQITKANVKDLEVAWTFPAGGSPTFSPTVIGDIIYVSGGGALVALEAGTGKELWRRQAQLGRGVNYWQSADGQDQRLILTSGGVSELNARTGEPIATFGQNGRVAAGGLSPDDRSSGGARGNPGRVCNDTIVVPLAGGGQTYVSNPGNIHGYDVRTGKLLWVFHTIPQPGEFGYETWPKEAYKTSGGVHNWSEMTVDEVRNTAFVPLGTPRYDFYGGDRHGQNLFGNSLLALDCTTGKRKWHYQMVHHDLWDYDLPVAPKLLTVRNNGRNVDIVAQATKMGFLFVFNRDTGEPLWPIVERPVPKSDAPGEQSWPTQPFPTKPPAFARQSFTEKDLNPFIPDAQKAAIRDQFRGYRNEGLYTPPSLQGSIEMPGHNGGANWGRVAVDPTKGTLYVVSSEQPTMIRLAARGAAGGAGGRGGAPAGGGRGGPGAGGAPAGGARGGPGAGGAPRGGTGAPGGAGAGRGRGGAPGGNNFVAQGPRATAVTPEGFVDFNSPVTFLNGPRGSGPMIGPPWSQLTAYDLNEGVIQWQVPNGEVPSLVAQGTKDTGAASPRGGPVVTAGGLIFVATSTDKKFRAFDQDNGKVVWETSLPAAAEGVPAVYESQGRQFIVIPVGGTGYLQSFTTTPAGPGEYRAYALPKK